MFKNLFGSKKKPDEIKIAEEAIEVLTMPEYGQHSEDLHIDEDYPDNVLEIENELIEPSEKTIYPIHNGIPTDCSDDYLFTNSQINGWPSTITQQLRFSGLILLYNPAQSVLDVGCGRADLYGFLRAVYPNNKINYIGIDSNTNILQIAERKYPILQKHLINSDILSYDSEFINYAHDWVFASGIFNLQEHSDQIEYTKLVIDKMMELAKVGVAFNLLTADLSLLPELEAKRWVQHDPGFWLNYLIEKYTKVISRADYIKNDITFIILK